MKICISDELKRTMIKIKKKDMAFFRRVQMKINQISACDEEMIHRFKNLRGSMSNYKRVHIGSYVLLFRIEGDLLIFDRLVHHDEAY